MGRQVRTTRNVRKNSSTDGSRLSTSCVSAPMAAAASDVTLEPCIQHPTTQYLQLQHSDCK
jgi:hypothetical protein